LLEVSDDVEESSNANNVGVEVLGVHHCHAVSCRVVVSKVEFVLWSICDIVVEDWDSSLFV
jgi:hypothetical protein